VLGLGGLATQPLAAPAPWLVVVSGPLETVRLAGRLTRHAGWAAGVTLAAPLAGYILRLDRLAGPVATRPAAAGP
jgi:hypothetical protein